MDNVNPNAYAKVDLTDLVAELQEFVNTYAEGDRQTRAEAAVAALVSITIKQCAEIAEDAVVFGASEEVCTGGACGGPEKMSRHVYERVIDHQRSIATDNPFLFKAASIIADNTKRSRSYRPKQSTKELAATKPLRLVSSRSIALLASLVHFVA